MIVGIIGSGMIGSTAARLLVDAGHSVVIANRRGPHSLKPLEHQLGANARAGTVPEAAAAGEVVLVAVPQRAVRDLPPGPFAGRIVVDATNYYPQRDGHVAALDAGATTSTELLAAHLPGARVVKAFNTMHHTTLAAAGDRAKPPDERLAIFLAGDDDGAKAAVAALVDELGFAPVDAGGLAEGGRRLQPGSPVYGADLTPPQARERLAGA